MAKKYIVRLTDTERTHLHETIKKLKGSSQKVRRAHILLKADSDGHAGTTNKFQKHSAVEPKLLQIFDNSLF